MTNPIGLLINGVCGRMGRRLVHLASQDDRFCIVAALETTDHPKFGHDLGMVIGQPSLEGLLITSEWPGNRSVEAVIDFSTPHGTAELLPICRKDHIPMVIATTGHSAVQLEALQEAGHELPLLMSSNFSLGMNLLMKLLAMTASALKEQDFDIEIIEKHHRFKKDSPSGTAIRLAQIIQEQVGPIPIRHGREGIVGERPRREIGVHSVRAGDEVGDHSVLFSTLGETLELHHRATSRDAFAKGALEAAHFLVNRPPGWYNLSDVLGL